MRDDLVAQVDDYLLPRLRQMEAPALIVVGGSTGAGKSTLVNSLIGAVVSPAGVLRPTTRAPVLACHPDDVRWFEDDRILPGLARTTGGRAATPARCSSSPTDRRSPPGLALLDSPDIDSVLAENRALANQLLAAADAWLFVTTAARYADAVPWEFLRAARERGTALSVVLNRVPTDAGREVPAHLRQMLREEDLGDSGAARRARRPARRRAAAGGRARAGARVARRPRCRRAGARGARPADAARRAREPSRPCRGRRARRGRAALGGVGAPGRGRRRVRRRARARSRRRCGAGRSCAARCSPAGTRSSGPET